MKISNASNKNSRKKAGVLVVYLKSGVRFCAGFQNYKHFGNNRIDNAERRCLLNETEPFY